MRKIVRIGFAVFVVMSLMGTSQGHSSLAAQEPPDNFAGHAFVGTWLVTTSSGLVLVHTAADGSIVMGVQATQAGPMGGDFVSSEIGCWEPVDARTAHFTAVQLLSDAEGRFRGTVTSDGYPVVSEDGQRFIDDGSRRRVTIRDESHEVLQTMTALPPLTGVRMMVDAPGFPEGQATTPTT